MSPGKEVELSKLMVIKISTADYENLNRLDVLGVASSVSDEGTVHQEFKEHLKKDKNGSYETGLIWKDNFSTLASNKSGSLGRLRNLLGNLQKDQKLFEMYDQVIQKQLAEGVVERAAEEVNFGQQEFYLTHKAAIRENVESTKLRIVYDASARENSRSFSLNDCLEAGPALQNLLWSVLIKTRFKPIALCGDLQKAFLQIRIKADDCDALRFHRIKDRDPNHIETLRFTRVVFGLVQSPFTLGGTLQEHLKSYITKYPIEVVQIKDDLYVDGLISGGNNFEQVGSLKNIAIEIFNQAGFKLHKWHSSNVSTLEEKEVVTDDQTYAKQQLGVKLNETKFLGLPWNKDEDKLSVENPSEAGINI